MVSRTNDFLNIFVSTLHAVDHTMSFLLINVFLIMHDIREHLSSDLEGFLIHYTI